VSALLVEGVGPLALVEDLGRPGQAALGVTTSGAADRPALRLGNRLVGNGEGHPVIEVLLGGLVLRADGPVTVAVTGAPAPLSLNGIAAPLCSPLDLRDGDGLTLGLPATGLRSYVAVRGGLTVERLFGSASTDPTSGLGPPRLVVGSRLEVGAAPDAEVRGVDVVGPAGPPVGDLVLHAMAGPRDDWFTSAALAALTGSAWAVTSESDRVGIRLSGPHLERAWEGELPSEGVVRGAIQVPASGQPLIFFADHPTTGGYPVIAVVLDQDTDALAQSRPGDRVRFQVRRSAGW
jgi:biotin-dependent carboxylase-like uncharacterized protein